MKTEKKSLMDEEMDLLTDEEFESGEWVKLPPLDPYLARTAPNKARYAQLHQNRVIPEEWFDGSIKPYKSFEDVYAACLKKGVTWEELLNYKRKEDITL